MPKTLPLTLLAVAVLFAGCTSAAVSSDDDALPPFPADWEGYSLGMMGDFYLYHCEHGNEAACSAAAAHYAAVLVDRNTSPRGLNSTYGGE